MLAKLPTSNGQFALSNCSSSTSFVLGNMFDILTEVKACGHAFTIRKGNVAFVTGQEMLIPISECPLLRGFLFDLSLAWMSLTMRLIVCNTPKHQTLTSRS